MNYNLLEEPWIPVLWHDGKYGRVGIKDALSKAGRIRQIAASNPMDRVAILRFLLAILYWCRGNPPDESCASDLFTPECFVKLDIHRDCFNLLGNGKRFYQSFPSISARTPEKLSANYLIQEIPTGTNKWHFRHSTDEVDGLCPACCAMGLLRLPLFATSGGRGKPPGINAKPPLYIVPISGSLAATLRLSWQPISELGTPTWEESDVYLLQTGKVPLLTGLTWLPRQVWLDNPDEPEIACVSCGKKDRLIRSCVFAGIGSTKTDEGGMGQDWYDPHVIYIADGKGDMTSLHASDALGVADAASGQWTKILAVMLSQQKTLDTKSKIWIVGFATVQNDKYLEAMEYSIPSLCAPELVVEMIEKIKQWQKESGRLEKRIGKSKVECAYALANIRPQVESIISAKAGTLLTGDTTAWEQASEEYSPMMAMIAQSLAPGVTTAALKRRREIAGIKPDVRLKAQKKGGNK